MKRPLAYITAPWSNNQYENAENAATYCRQVYDAGYSPICPVLFLSTFLKDEIPQEHKDGLDMARDYLRRSHVLVVCGHGIDETVKNDIATAERLRITATTLDGILTVKGQGCGKGGAPMPERKTVGQLMEEMRLKAGAQNYHGHEYMDLERFAEDTRHMIIFDVLTHDSPVGWKGERTRLFLTEAGYQKSLENQEKGHIKILSHAKVRQGHLYYDRSDQLR